MPKKRIDRFINEALQEFSSWLKVNQWRGKENECVNLFAHKFLIGKIEPGAAIECPTQICIECPLKQSSHYIKKTAKKDLLIYGKPLQTAWSENWEPDNLPKAVLEWKVHRESFPKQIFDKHDEEWISSYTKENDGKIGYVISVDLTLKKEPIVYWKKAKQGVFTSVKYV